MKAFLYTISIALILVMKAELIALVIAAVLWLILIIRQRFLGINGDIKAPLCLLTCL